MSAGGGHDRLWSVVLAGGEGERIQPFIQRWLGRARAKQYCTFVGERSLLQHTLDRADRLGRPEQRVTVMARWHEPEIETQFRARVRGRIVLQPANRDTAAGIFLALTYVRAYEPKAVVVVYPSDHFVHPEPAFAEEVGRAAAAAQRLSRLVLLGATPEGPEVEYGWIVPGRELGRGSACPARQVSSFLEKPGVTAAERALASGGLWNTLIMAGPLETLWSLGWRCLPTMMPLFQELAGAIGTPRETPTLEAIYQVMPRLNFSSDLLARAPEQVAVMPLRGVLWNDWGRPERIAETLSRMGRVASFPLEVLDGAWAATRGGANRKAKEPWTASAVKRAGPGLAQPATG